MYPRWIEKRIREEMADTRVVLLAGPRQAGKTTLAKKIAAEHSTFLTLDDTTVLNAAKSDPVGFVRGLDRATIDEIQRAPELLLALKRSVDDDPRPGRFLLTGSANLMAIPQAADSLAGRMAIIDLLPLSVAEVRQQEPCFFAEVFEGRIPKPGATVTGDDLVAAVLPAVYRGSARKHVATAARVCLDNVRAKPERDVRDSPRSRRRSSCPSCCACSPNIPPTGELLRARRAAGAQPRDHPEICRAV
jgi:hypothetical protein